MTDKPRDITEADWKAAEKKWGPKCDHSGMCNFCERLELYFEKELWYRIIPSRVCLKYKCPLATKQKKDRWSICCNNLWSKWYDNMTKENAAKVLAFIKKEHKRWSAKQKAKK